MRLLDAARRAADTWIKAPLWLLCCMALDALFFIVYGFTTAPIQDKILQHVLVIGGLMAQSAPDTGSRAVQSGKSIVTLLLGEPSITPYVYQILWLFLLLAVASFVVYVLFQATVWYIAHKRLGEPRALPEFMSAFTWLNVWWGILFLLYSILSLLVSIRAAVIEALSGTPQVDVLGVVLMGVASVVALVATWTYARRPHKSGWRAAIDGMKWVVRDWKATLPATIIVVGLFVVINYCIIGLSYLSSVLALGAGIVLSLVVLSFARMFMIEVAHVG